MKKICAVFLGIACVSTSMADEAKGSVVSNLQINCEYKVENELKMNVNVSVTGDLYRLRGNQYTTTVVSDLIQSPDLASGKKSYNNFFASKGEKLSLVPIQSDSQNNAYEISLPRNAIYPTAEGSSYDAQLTRTNWQDHRLSKKFPLKCVSKSEVENIVFPYLNATEFAAMPVEMQWRFIANSTGAVTHDKFRYLQGNAGSAVTAKNEETWGRWLGTVKTYTSDDAQGLSADIDQKIAQALRVLDNELRLIDETLMDVYDLTQDDLDEVGGGTGQVQVITSMQGTLLGLVVSVTSSNATEDSDDDAGNDIYFDANMNQISNEEWSN